MTLPVTFSLPGPVAPILENHGFFIGLPWPGIHRLHISSIEVKYPSEL